MSAGPQFSTTGLSSYFGASDNGQRAHFIFPTSAGHFQRVLLGSLSEGFSIRNSNAYFRRSAILASNFAKSMVLRSKLRFSSAVALFFNGATLKRWGPSMSASSSGIAAQWGHPSTMRMPS